MRKYLFILLAVLCLGLNAYAFDPSGQLGDAWLVEKQEDGGSIVPDATGQDIGTSALPVDVLYVNTVTKSTADKGTVKIPLTMLVASPATVLTSSTVPGIEADNGITSLVWSDNETTPVYATFMVPNDYLSGGVFKLFCDSSNSTTPEQVDFVVLVNKSATPWDSVGLNQTPVALTQTAGTPEQVTLTVATDFSALAAADKVTLGLWRDNVSTGTGDLELYDVIFEYNRK